VILILNLKKEKSPQDPEKPKILIVCGIMGFVETLALALGGGGHILSFSGYN
jgi:hypothetical protein